MFQYTLIQLSICSLAVLDFLSLCPVAHSAKRRLFAAGIHLFKLARCRSTPFYGNPHLEFPFCFVGLVNPTLLNYSPSLGRGSGRGYIVLLVILPPLGEGWGEGIHFPLRMGVCPSLTNSPPPEGWLRQQTGWSLATFDFHYLLGKYVKHI